MLRWWSRGARCVSTGAWRAARRHVSFTSSRRHPLPCQVNRTASLAVRTLTQFNVAAVRLLRLTLLDKPPLPTSTPQRHPRETTKADGTALARSHQQSASSTRFIPPAVLQDAEAWERWMDGVDGEQTFLVSRTLFPQLLERLNAGEGQSTDTTARVAADSSTPTTLQRAGRAVDERTQASSVQVATSTTSVALLQRQLDAVHSSPLATLVAPQHQRTKQLRASTAIPPAPTLQVPLTAQQKAIFAAISSATLDAFAIQWSAADMSVLRPHPSHGGTVLHVAAMHDRADVVEWLLNEQRAPVDSRAFNHSTPLHWAAGNNALASMRALLAHGADPTLVSMTHHSSTVGKGSGQTALHWAAESGHVHSVQLLSEWAPQLVAVQDERGRGAKELAESEGRSEVVRLVQRLESEEYVAVKVELAYRGQRIIGAQQRRDGGARSSAVDT